MRNKDGTKRSKEANFTFNPETNEIVTHRTSKGIRSAAMARGLAGLAAFIENRRADIDRKRTIRNAKKQLRLRLA